MPFNRRMTLRKRHRYLMRHSVMREQSGDLEGADCGVRRMVESGDKQARKESGFVAGYSLFVLYGRAGLERETCCVLWVGL